ncbi:hypothetical protein Q8F55_005129 [Vanrija albida]|uniref:Uncharacterized protein n=1 Tax=Vanrija albida TaxID=181172 RepID=A0ABR3Q0S3_9TREE
MLLKPLLLFTLALAAGPSLAAPSLRVRCWRAPECAGEQVYDSGELLSVPPGGAHRTTLDATVGDDVSCRFDTWGGWRGEFAVGYARRRAQQSAAGRQVKRSKRDKGDGEFVAYSPSGSSDGAGAVCVNKGKWRFQGAGRPARKVVAYARRS